ncbi:hypothetical protein ACN47E_001362 [Coniothyrium glycines]
MNVQRMTHLPAMHDTSSAAHDTSNAHLDHSHHDGTHNHHHHQHHHDHHMPDDPPPSYDDAIGSGTAPLLVGPRSNYGAFRTFSDVSSTASSETEATGQTLTEWIGQALVVFVFIVIIYGFWQFINEPTSGPG